MEITKKDIMIVVRALQEYRDASRGFKETADRLFEAGLYSKADVEYDKAYTNLHYATACVATLQRLGVPMVETEGEGLCVNIEAFS